MKKKLIMLLTAAMLASSFVPALPAMTATVYAAESASQQIFNILTQEGGLNSAAACGIIGNLQQESGLNPNAQSSFYGLAQWSSSRASNLRSFCAANGYDSASVAGQTRFILHELQNGYTGVLSQLQSVPNNAEGAQAAMRAFCHDFEQCGNYDWEYNTRGSFTSTYFGMYGSSASQETEETNEEETNAAEVEETTEEVSEEVTEETTEEASEEVSEDVTEEAEETNEEESEDVVDEETYEEESEEASYEEEETYDDADEETYEEESKDSETSAANYDSDVQYLLDCNYDVSLIFDYDYYVSRYPEVKNEVGSSYDAVLRQFLTEGVSNGRRGSLNFSVLNYQDNNPDLVDKYADEYVKYYVQYVKSGYYEGRSGTVSSEQHEKEQANAAAEAEWQEYLNSIGMTEEEFNQAQAEKNNSEE